MYKQNSYVWVIACIMLVAVSGSFDVGKFIAPLIVVSAFAFVATSSLMSSSVGCI